MGAAGFRCNLKENSVRFISYLSLERFALRISKHLNAERQFARVAKGVDLRSTAGNCAWVRTPQLTSLHTWVDRPTLFCAVDAFAGHW